MASRRATAITVLGAGIAGLAAALALGRDGHRVTVIDRDEVTSDEPLDALGWVRKGIPHFMQPHAFTPRGRKEMQETFPDVFEALVEAGAWRPSTRPQGGPVRRAVAAGIGSSYRPLGAHRESPAVLGGID